MSNKTITIDGKEYHIGCNAYTRFQYKKVFGTGLMQDIQKLSLVTTKQQELRDELKKKKVKEDEIEQQVNAAFMEDMDDFIDIIEKMTYILIITATPNFGTFEEFLKGINVIDLSSGWIQEVTELAVSSFR